MFPETKMLFPEDTVMVFCIVKYLLINKYFIIQNTRSQRNEKIKRTIHTKIHECEFSPKIAPSRDGARDFLYYSPVKTRCLLLVLMRGRQSKFVTLT